MKREFNLRSANPLGILSAAALAMPALFLTVQQYGVTGLLVASGIVAMTSGPYVDAALHTLSKHKHFAEHYPHIDTPEEVRLQKICDELSPAFGLSGIKTTMTKPSSSFAAAFTKRIYVTSEMVRNLDNDELRFVLAHELDHIRSRDHYMINASFLASSTIFGASLLSGIDMLTRGALHITAYNNFLLTMGAFAGIVTSLSLAKRKLSREFEYRADGNALRVTKKPEKAISALRKTFGLAHNQAMAMGMHLEPEKPGHWKNLLGSHPLISQRITNIRKIGEGMGAASPHLS